MIKFKVNHVGEICNNRIITKREGKRWTVKCLKCGDEQTMAYTQWKKHGCNKCWKNTVDEDYFKVIDTEQKAYFLGFLFADGYVSSKFKSCKIDLQECDEDLLIQFKQAVNFSGKITQYVAKKGQSYRSEEAIVKRIHIINQKFADNLEKQGVFAHREKSNFPFENIPVKYYKDFIRGYFDGNGSVSVYNNNKSCLINFCGGTHILADIEKITNQFDFHWNHHARKLNNPDNDQLFLLGTLNEKTRFLDWLYKDSKNYLIRKYNKYLFLLQPKTNSNS